MILIISHLLLFADGNETTPIACDASASQIKKSLENLDSISSVDVTRSEATTVGGYTWTIAFLEDSVGTHRGDMEEFRTISLLSSGTNIPPSIEVVELRKGTFKEVQRIRVSAGGTFVDSGSSFKLRFNGESTASMLALPLGGTTCLGSTTAKQIITTSTEDTRAEGGDNTVSTLTKFVIGYDGYETKGIAANSGSCDAEATVIAEELMKFPPLREVHVSGSDSGAGDGGCKWVVSLLSVTGIPELFSGMF